MIENQGNNQDQQMYPNMQPAQGVPMYQENQMMAQPQPYPEAQPAPEIQPIPMAPVYQDPQMVVQQPIEVAPAPEIQPVPVVPIYQEPQVVVQPTPEIIPTPEVQPIPVAPEVPVVPAVPEADTSSITFDYNQLYNNQQAPVEGVAQENSIDQASTPGIVETPIVLGVEQPAPKDVTKDVIPAFDMAALEDLPDELKKNVPAEPLIHTIAKETQNEKDQYKRNLIFIAVFFAVLIIAVVFIFPMLLGM